MASWHTVIQGEQLSGIAAAAGFRDFRVIWNRPENEDLRNQRDNPHVLFPGDKVFIPDKQPKTLQRDSDLRHRFVVGAQPLELHVVLDRLMFEPIANAPCTIDLGTINLGDPQPALTTDGDGKISRTIPASATDGSLLVQDQIVLRQATLPVDIEMMIHVGSLDPPDQQSGQVARLSNLAYYRASVDDAFDPAEFRSAVEEFQCDSTLTVTGTCDSATQDKLLDVHGS